MEAWRTFSGTLVGSGYAWRDKLGFEGLGHSEAFLKIVGSEVAHRADGANGRLDMARLKKHQKKARVDFCCG